MKKKFSMQVRAQDKATESTGEITSSPYLSLAKFNNQDICKKRSTSDLFYKKTGQNRYHKTSVFMRYCFSIIFSCMSNSREGMVVNGEALQLNTVYKKPYFFTSHARILYQVLQVMRATSERAMKSKVCMILP